jgi:hypothetical protein
VAPAIESLNVPKIAAHFFILYIIFSIYFTKYSLSPLFEEV